VQGIKEAILIAISRVKTLSKQPDIEYVAYFKNERPEAGASINHQHSQIIALGVIPHSIQEQHRVFAQVRANTGFSPLYSILDHERGGTRIIRETKHFVALCPYASRFALEVLIIPLRDSHSYTTLSDEEAADLSEIIHSCAYKLSTINAPFNIEWMHSHQENGFHWYVSITPRLNIWAGFEIETDIIVNPVPPEDAATFYQQ
jgi:UDPglucose--hexose-1-phosphate uridylyltransferase